MPVAIAQQRIMLCSGASSAEKHAIRQTAQEGVILGCMLLRRMLACTPERYPVLPLRRRLIALSTYLVAYPHLYLYQGAA